MRVSNLCLGTSLNCWLNSIILSSAISRKKADLQEIATKQPICKIGKPVHSYLIASSHMKNIGRIVKRGLDDLVVLGLPLTGKYARILDECAERWGKTSTWLFDPAC